MDRHCPLCDGANDLYLECRAQGDYADGLISTGSETCDPSLDCQAGTLPVIDDGVSWASQSLEPRVEAPRSRESAARFSQLPGASTRVP